MYVVLSYSQELYHLSDPRAPIIQSEVTFEVRESQGYFEDETEINL